MAIKQYTLDNTTTSKQFNSALTMVMGSIAQRNEQVQQLAIIAVNEAARLNGDLPTNNLDWLTNLLVKAEQTKGINLAKLVKYVKEVLCCNTVSWNKEKSRLKKVNDKTVKLTYNVKPDVKWFDYGKKPTVARAFNYPSRITSSINSGMNAEKGGMTLAEVMKAVIAADDVTLDELMQAIAEVNPLDKAA